MTSLNSHSFISYRLILIQSELIWDLLIGQWLHKKNIFFISHLPFGFISGDGVCAKKMT